MKFDMHCHTKEGSLDGRITIAENIRMLKEAGYDGMLVSDHNTYLGYHHYEKYLKEHQDFDFVVLKGIEYDTLDCGHILVILPSGIRVPLIEVRGLPVALLIDIVHHYGGILGPAHPYGETFLSFKRTWRGRKDNLTHKFDFFETFNACESEEANELAQNLARKFHRPGFGGSDSHRDIGVGFGYTEIDATIRTEDDLIAAVKKGVSFSAGGIYFRQTTKDKLGPFNKILVYSFWLYNKICAALRLRRRRHALKNHQSQQ